MPSRDGEVRQIKAQANESRQALAARQLEAMRAGLRFTEADLQSVRQQELARQQRLDKSSAAAQARAEQLARELSAKTRTLQSLRSAQPAATADQLAVAESEVRALAAAAETARLEGEVLRASGTLSATMVEAWRERYDALHSPSAERRIAASATLRVMRRGASIWTTFANAELTAVRAEQAARVQAAEQTGGNPEVLRHEAAWSESLNQRTLLIQQLVDEVERDQRTIGRWREEIGADREQRSWQDRLAAVWAEAAAIARTVWAFELFAIEDTVELQGQKVTTTRGVTVGKSIGALLIFLAGYWLASRLTHRMERTLIARFAVDAPQARTVRRWVMTAVGLMLLVMTLNLAQIPLTVFAFLGGALAIGVGFGMQTIIKNLISGLILLMERQVRVGDSVEVDGFSGTVTEVNLRSSTIRGFDGIDAIVPNSALLEGRVIN